MRDLGAVVSDNRSRRSVRSVAFAVLAVVCASGIAACGGAQRNETAAHSGWTLHYTHRTGAGIGSARDVRPDVRVEVIDDRFRVTSPERALDVRANAARRVVQVCRDGRCQLSNFDQTLAAVTAVDEGGPAPGLREEPPTTETLSDPESIANVSTRGARFVSIHRSAAGTFRATIEVRWIEEPGDRAVEAVKTLLLAPLVRRGLSQLVAEIRRTVGLPLQWHAHIGIDRGDAPAEGTTTIVRAASLDDPPAAIAAP